VRLQLHALAYNLGNFLRTLATPEPIKDWSLTSLKDKPGKMPRSDPRPSVRVIRGAGSGQHLASVLQEGRENANIDAGLGFIWGISVNGIPSSNPGCHVLGITAGRAAEVDFSPPYLQADLTYLVPAGSSVRRVADADQPGVRIAVVRNHAMDFALRGKLKQAEPVYAETPDAAFDLLRTGHVTVLAGIRPGLLKYSTQLPGSRVLEDRYGANVIGMAVRKGQAGWLGYVSEFIAEPKTSGLVEQAMERAGMRGIQVVSQQSPN
jgi:ABC-type amino acid transport substrate-binding protein